jgi:hypothetical protein
MCGRKARRSGLRPARTRAIDLEMKCRDRLYRGDPREQGAARAMIEPADPGEREVNRRGMDRAERGVDILGYWPVDLADVTDRDMELLLVLPSPARWAIVHCREAGLAHRGRRTEGDKQSVHRPPLSREETNRDRIRLKAGP